MIFEINFTGTIEGKGETQDYSEEGNLTLLYKYDFWCIQAVEFPTAVVN